MGNLVSKCAQNARKVWKNCASRKHVVDEESKFNACDREPQDNHQEFECHCALTVTSSPKNGHCNGQSLVPDYSSNQPHCFGEDEHIQTPNVEGPSLKNGHCDGRSEVTVEPDYASNLPYYVGEDVQILAPVVYGRSRKYRHCDVRYEIPPGPEYLSNQPHYVDGDGQMLAPATEDPSPTPVRRMDTGMDDPMRGGSDQINPHASLKCGQTRLLGEECQILTSPADDTSHIAARRICTEADEGSQMSASFNGAENTDGRKVHIRDSFSSHVLGKDCISETHLMHNTAPSPVTQTKFPPVLVHNQSASSTERRPAVSEQVSRALKKPCLVYRHFGNAPNSGPKYRHLVCVIEPVRQYPLQGLVSEYTGERCVRAVHIILPFDIPTSSERSTISYLPKF